MTLRLLVPCAAVLLLTPGLARGDGPARPLGPDPGPPAPIWNGVEAGPCEWPSVVQMEDSCTGTLVHPQVVIYAGHCGDEYGNVFFGEGGTNVAFSAATEFCVSRGFLEGLDYSVCKLKEPVENVPIVPILMGCETDALKVGEEVTMIGFGEAEEPKPYGIKRIAHSTIADFSGDEIFIMSDDGMDTCFGDSGGPVMIQLADGTWRVFGITSYGLSDECGTGTWYSMMHTDLAWFEEQVGIDISPCHTPDGVWDPTAKCGGFPEDPGTGVGAWNACGIGPVGELSATCGMMFGARPDDVPPMAEVTSPETGLEFMSVNALPLTITGTARDGVDKPEGWGVTEARLVINSQSIANSERFIPPYSWDAQLPTGQYLIQVLAVDNAGNEGLSPFVAIGVNMPPPAIPEPPDETTGGSTGEDTQTQPTDAEQSISAGESSSSSSSGDPGEDDDPLPPEAKPCGCRSTSAVGDGLASLAALLLLRRRRRG